MKLLLMLPIQLPLKEHRLRLATVADEQMLLYFVLQEIQSLENLLVDLPVLD